MRRLIYLLMMFVACDAMAQAATQPVSKPTTVIAQSGCVTAQCHANVKQYKVMHGPVNVNACDACHKLTDPAEHRFDLTRDKQQLVVDRDTSAKGAGDKARVAAEEAAAAE